MDQADRLTGQFNRKADGTMISSFEYQLDPTGNRTAVAEATGQRTTWSYDETYQLTNEHRSGTGGFNTTHVYDPAGNRLVKNASGALTTSAYDAADQLTNSVDSSGTTTYTFDADGNQQIEDAPGGRTTNVWNYENQMIGVIKPDASRVTMLYNADYRRVRKES
jgi:YD repeat-containing protein